MVTTIDKGHDVPVYSPICAYCKHWKVGSGRTCDAFPNSIPIVIWLGKNNHRKPYPGDHGIRFEPIEREK